MNKIENSNTKYILVLKPFAQSDAELLKKVKALLLTEFNLPIYEIQKILEKLPAEIIASYALPEITEKKAKLTNIGIESYIESSKDSGSSLPSSSEKAAEPALSLHQKTSKGKTKEQVSLEPALDDSPSDETKDEPDFYIKPGDLDLLEQWRKLYSTNAHWIDSTLEIVLMIFFASIVLYFTNRMLVEPAKDPTATLQQRIQELQNKRIILERIELYETRNNPEYTLESSLSLLGDHILKTVVKVNYKTEAEPNADDIILGKGVKSFIRSINLDSELRARIEEHTVKIKTVAKVEVERAYQVYSEYIETVVQGKLSQDGKSFNGRIIIADGLPVDQEKEIAEVELTPAGALKNSLQHAIEPSSSSGHQGSPG